MARTIVALHTLTYLTLLTTPRHLPQRVVCRLNELAHLTAPDKACTQWSPDICYLSFPSLRPTLLVTAEKKSPGLESRLAAFRILLFFVTFIAHDQRLPMP